MVKRQGQFPIGVGSLGLANDGTSIWVGDRQGHSVGSIRKSDGAFMRGYRVGSGTGRHSFRRYIYVDANQGSDTVTKITPSRSAE
jgi:hypothetical protein